MRGGRGAGDVRRRLVKSSIEGPPAALDTVDVLHGTPVADPYRWLEDGSSHEVAAWVQEQHARARRHLDALAGRSALARRLNCLLRVDAVSVPQRAGKRIFYSRRSAGKEVPVTCWREGDEGTEHVLIDPNALWPDGGVALGVCSPSPDGEHVAFGLHVGGADAAHLYVMAVAAAHVGEVGERDRIEGAGDSPPAWAPDGGGFYYVDPARAEIRFHRLGTDPGDEPVIDGPITPPGARLGVQLSRDGHWLFASVSTFSGDDLYYQDLRKADRAWETLISGVEANFSVVAWEDRFYVLTSDGAPRGRIFAVDPAAAGRQGWREIVAESPDAVLRAASIVGNRLALTYVGDASGRIEVRSLDGDLVEEISLPGIGSVSGVVGAPDEDAAYFQFSSYLHPPQIMQLSATTGEARVWSAVAREVDPAPFTVQRVRYPSRDGTLIPMFLVHRRDLKPDGSTPFLLTGYGGFGASMEPAFDPTVYPWLEAGGGLAVANLRGGGEFGEEWHRAGVGERKQNVIDDFIAAAEFLVRQGYTTPRRLAIEGGSNGGLVVAAALTQRPDLFGAAVCVAPLCDMVRYHLFGAGPSWVSEYGCADDVDAFGYLYAYSPYHRVTAGVRYPPMLFLAGESDDRVDPLHARKMVAALQAAQGGEAPVFLRIEAQAGHGGADRIRGAVETWTDCYAFLFDALGMTPASLGGVDT